MKCVHIDDSTLNAIRFAKMLIKYTIDGMPVIKSDMSSELMGYMLTHMQRLTDFIETVEEADET